jgi:hypothetical protein
VMVRIVHQASNASNHLLDNAPVGFVALRGLRVQYAKRSP